MSARNALKLVHVVSTLWIVLVVAYIAAFAMYQAKLEWWVIFSTSGYSAVIGVLLLCVYLFAIYRGPARGQEPVEEHPLTSSFSYMGLYSASPLLGALAGVWGAIGTDEPTQFLMILSIGTLVMTFFIWIILDPLVGLIELNLPKCKTHRQDRLTLAQLREKKDQQRRQLLQQLVDLEEIERKHHQVILADDAEKLSKLVLAENQLAGSGGEQLAIDMGLKAWRMGGISCMVQLQEMALAVCKQHREHVIDYISIWWDGIGDWRCPCVTAKS